MSYIKCEVCREGEGCQTGVTLAEVLTPQVCTIIVSVCTCISVASFVAIVYVTQLG